jgi:phosphate transport system permease protein
LQKGAFRLHNAANILLVTVFYIALFTIVLLSGMVILTAFRFGFPHISVDFLVSPSSGAGSDGGIFYQIIGTLLLALVAIPVTFYFGVSIAMWGHCRPKNSRSEKLFETVLCAAHAIPSLVWGLLGFLLFVRMMGFGKSWVAGGLTLALVSVPAVVDGALAKLRAIGSETFDAAQALALGENEIHRRILFPYAMTGAASNMRVAVPRLLGETAPLLLTASVYSGVTVPEGIRDSPVVTMTNHIFVLSQDVISSNSLEKAAATGVSLIFLAFFFRFVFSFLTNRLNRRL